MLGYITELLGSTGDGGAGNPNTKHLHFIREKKAGYSKMTQRETEMGFGG